MGILDSVIVLSFLVFIIIGFIKGFIKQVFSTLGWIIALAAASLLSKPAGNMLFQTNVGIGINGAVYNWISSKGEFFTTSIPQLTADHLGEALTKLGVPSFLHGAVSNMIDVSAYQDICIAEIVSPKIAQFALVSVSFILIYLVVFIIAKIIASLAKKIVRGSALGFFDGLLGAAWSAVKVAFFVSLGMLLLSLVTTMPFGASVSEWITNDMKLLEEGFGIAKYFYEYNPIIYVINFFK